MDFLLSLSGSLHWGSFKRSREQKAGAAWNPPEIFLVWASGELNTVHAQSILEPSTYLSQSRKGKQEHHTDLCWDGAHGEPQAPRLPCKLCTAFSKIPLEQ